MRLLVGVLLLPGLLLISSPAGAASPTTSTPHVVVLDTGTPAVGPTVDALARRGGFATTARYGAALEGFAADLTPAQRRALAAHPNVAFVQPDSTVTVAGMTAVAPGETVPPGIRRTGAATLISAHPAADAGVAVVDSGIDPGSADLTVGTGVNCVKAGAAPVDDNGHGTHVAGIVAARNGSGPVVGAAPGTRVHPVKVLNARGSGTLSQLLCGLDWVAANAAVLGIRVATASLAGGGANDGACGRLNADAEHLAICRVTDAGVAIVAAAGNAGADFARTVPAAYPEVLTATAMTDTDGRSGRLGPAAACARGSVDDTAGSYSNFAVAAAERDHAIAAPGTCVLSDKPGGATATYTGTSQAAPHVAGALALCLGSGGIPGPCAGLKPAGVIQRIRADAAGRATTLNGFAGDPLRPTAGRYYGNLVAFDPY